MAMEPTGQYGSPSEKATYEVQLMNLGRIIENPKLVSTFEPEDFINSDISILIRMLKSDKPIEAKRLHLKVFMKHRGVKNWGDDSEGCKRELFDTQRKQAIMVKLAWQMNVAMRRLHEEGHTGNSSEALDAIEKMKGFITDAST